MAEPDLTPHPYELGMRNGRWQPHGCKHCDHPAGSDIHNPESWDPTWNQETSHDGGS